MEKQPSESRAVVLVIDLQTGMFDGKDIEPIYMADVLTERVRAITAWARSRALGVCFIRHDGPPGDSLAPGEAGWPVWPALGQGGDEPTFSKTVGDAFSQPKLVEWLDERGTREVILLGAQTDHCVAATVAGGLQRGLAVTVVGDSHSTWEFEGETAEEIIRRHNTLFETSGARLVTTDALIGG